MKMKHHIHGTPGKMTGGTTLVDDRPRADAFWPAWMFALGLFFALFGVILGTVSIVLQFPIFLILGAVVLALIGVAALMCWKNQTIHLQPNDTFVHSTFLGRKKAYRFSEIKGVKKGNGYTFLLVGVGKVYIDSSMIVSDALMERINSQLQEKDQSFP